MAKKKLKARGNFRRVTPAVAEKYVNHWKKKGITRAEQIPDSKDAAFQRIRLREALSVMRDYGRKMEVYEAEKAAYDRKVAEFKALGDKKVFENAGLPAKYLRPKAPVKPAKTGPRSARGGNFKRVSKKQALTYLRSLFTNAAKNAVAKNNRVTLDRLSSSKSGRGKQATRDRQTFGPRGQEAVLLVGPEKAADLWTKANTLQTKLAEKRAKNAQAAEKRKAKVDAAKVARLEKQIANAQKRLANLSAARAGISAARRARRSRKMRRRTRRTRRARR